MIRRISEIIGGAHPGAFYLASAVVLSLSVNTFTSAYGAVPSPPNQFGLVMCSLLSFISAVALSTLAWRLETVRQIVNDRARDAGTSPASLMIDTIQTFVLDISVRIGLGLSGAVGSVVALIVLR